MGVGKLFDSTMQVLKRALDTRLEKHAVITSNLANAEIPGYKFRDISFQDTMRRAMDGKDAELRRTNNRHFPVNGANSSTVTVESTNDIDQEMVKLAENNLMYQASVQLLAKKFEMIRTVVTEGGK